MEKPPGGSKTLGKQISDAYPQPYYLIRLLQLGIEKKGIGESGKKPAIVIGKII